MLHPIYFCDMGYSIKDSVCMEWKNPTKKRGPLKKPPMGFLPAFLFFFVRLLLVLILLVLRLLCCLFSEVLRFIHHLDDIDDLEH